MFFGWIFITSIRLLKILPGGAGGILCPGICKLGGNPGGGPGGSPWGLPGGGPGGNILGGAPGGPPLSGGGLNIMGGTPGGGPIRTNNIHRVSLLGCCFLFFYFKQHNS